MNEDKNILGRKDEYVSRIIKDSIVIEYMAIVSGCPPRYSKTLQPLNIVGDFFDNWHDHRNGMMPEFDSIVIYQEEEKRT